MLPKSSNQSSSFGEMIKTGFAISIGSWFMSIIAIGIAMALFIPGFLMVRKENKKEKIKQEEDGEGDGPNKTKKIIGYILMGLGMIFGFGFGSTIFFSLLANEI